MSTERSRSIVGVFLLVGVLFVIFMVFAFYTVSTLKQTSELSSGDLTNFAEHPIAVVTVEGPIMESKKIVQMLHAAEEEKSIEAIIVRIDSPGGAVAPTQEIYEEMRRIDKIKPVYASFASLAASGGYYIGAAARKIYALPGTITGSIGVIMQFADLSELFAFAKIKPMTLKAGQFKDIGSPHRGMSEEEKRILDASLQLTHQQFIQDILTTREAKLTQKPAQFAQGQIFNGAEALQIGLVDELGGLWEAGRKIHKELKMKKKFGLRFVKPKRERMTIMDLLNEGEEVMSLVKSKLQPRSQPAFLMSY